MPIIGIIASGDQAAAAGTSFESIATITASSSQQAVTFSNIPQTYKHLQIRGITKGTDSTISSMFTIYLRANGDSGSNYANHGLEGNGASVVFRSASSSTLMTLHSCIISSGSLTGSAYGVSIIDILDYANTSKNKTVKSFGGGMWNTTSSAQRVGFASGLWMSTTAITSITIGDNNGGLPGFTTGTTFALYGIKG